MKRIFIVIFLLSCSLFAVNLKWYHDYKNAVMMAKKLNKPIFMMYSMST